MSELNVIQRRSGVFVVPGDTPLDLTAELLGAGRLGYADESYSTGDTVLGEKPIVGIDQIAAQAEFSPSIIDLEEFRQVWRRAATGGRNCGRGAFDEQSVAPSLQRLLRLV